MRNNRGISIVDEIVLAVIVVIIIFAFICWRMDIDPTPTLNAILDYILASIS